MKKTFSNLLKTSAVYLFAGALLLLPFAAQADSQAECTGRGGTWTEAGNFTSGSCSVAAVSSDCLCYSDNSVFCPAINPQCKNATTDPAAPSYIPPGSTAANPQPTSGTCPNGQPQRTITVNGQQVLAGCDLGYTPLEPIPGVTTNANGSALDFPHLVGRIYYVAIIIGALFSVLMLTISGIRYMLSDVVTDKARAIQRIKACIYGLILIAASWLILNTINPQLVTFSLNPCPQGGCTITGGQSSGSGGGGQNCGNYGPCNSANTYCGTINGETSCIPNEEQSAEKGCKTAGGAWSNSSYDGSYCYIEQYKNKQSCEGVGAHYHWTIGYFSTYCTYQ